MKIYFIIMLAAITATGCQKGKSDVIVPDETPTGSKIKTWATDQILNYLYDESGRVVKTSKSDGSTTEYVYAPGMITRKIFNSGGDFLYSYNYQLNPEGRIFRTTKSNNAAYEELDYYNADGTIAKAISNISGNTTVVDYFYSNGNCDSARFSGSSGWSSSVIKTYYTDKLNVLSSDTYGEYFNGKNNKNLLKTEKYSYPDGTPTETAVLTYEFDQKGRVIKQTGTKGSNIKIDLITYY